MTAFATGDNLCDHHTVHTAECGYVEGVSDCAYHCDICLGHSHEDDEGNSETPAPVCDCGTDDALIHTTTCAVYAAPENPVCYCTEKCAEPNIWCDVCGFDVTACQGSGEAAVYYTKPTAREGLIYNGSDQELINLTEPDEGYYWGFMTYGTGADPIFRIPETYEAPAKTDVDKYTVSVFHVPESLSPDSSNPIGDLQATWVFDLYVYIYPAVTTAPVIAAGLEANGSTQNLLAQAGTATGGVNPRMLYSVTDANATNPGTFSTALPTAKDAGNYKVWYKAAADSPGEKYNNVKYIEAPNSAAQVVQVTIAPGATSQITWVVEGETYATTSQSAGENLTLPAAPTKAPSNCVTYAFDGWFTAAEGGERVTAETIYTAKNDTTYYAQFKKVYSHDPALGSFSANGFCPNGCCTPATDSNSDGIYEIANGGQMFWFAEQINSGALARNTGAVLTADIDLENRDWTTICPTGLYYDTTTYSDTGYTGTFDGQGHTISNYTVKGIYGTKCAVGLFGTLSGKVQNLGVTNMTFQLNGATDVRAAAIVGQMLSGSEVSNCYVTNSTLAPKNFIVSGIAACNYDGMILRCFTYNVTVDAHSRCGNLVSDCRGDLGTEDRTGSVLNCWTDAARVTGTQTSSGEPITFACYPNASGDLASGRAAWNLNALASEGIWKQNIGADVCPNFMGKTVYYGYETCISTEMTYTNTPASNTWPGDHAVGEEGYTPGTEGTHSSTCPHCGEVTVGTCSGGTATCAAKAKCDKCGGEHGDLAPHSTTADGDEAATCTNGAYCSVCKSYYGEMDKTNHDESVEYKNGICPNCDAYEPAELKDNVYQIANAGNLFWFAQQVNNDIHGTDGDGNKDFVIATAILTADIDLENRKWTPIGALYSTADQIGNHFAGIFDGNHKKIENLYVEATTGDTGFFGEIRGATVKDFEISGKIVVKTDGIGYIGIIGAVCGHTSDFSALDQSKVSGITSHVVIELDESVSFTKLEYIGGIAGYTNQNPTIENCVWDGTINLGSFTATNVGGIVGHIQDNSTTIQNCAAYGTITYTGSGALVWGGIVGYPRAGSSKIENCFTTASNVCGAVNTYVTVNNSYNGTDYDAAPSGEIAYNLGAAWGQTLGEDGDEYPILGGAKVYCGYTSCGDMEKIYTNNSSVSDEKPSHTAEPTYEPITGGIQHVATYSCCATVVTESHKINTATGKCVCGMEMAEASVTMDGTTTYYDTLNAAISDVADCTAEDNAVVKLEENVYVDYGQKITSGTFTVDLNGKSLSGEGDGFEIYGGSTNVTITDSGETGVVESAGYSVIASDNSTVTVSSGTFHDVVSAYGNSTVTVNGGTLYGGVSASDNSTLTITGGTFNGRTFSADTYTFIDSAAVFFRHDPATLILTLAEGETEGAIFPYGISVKITTLKDILGEGMAYWQDDKLLVPADDQYDITGSVVIKAACDHSGNENDYTYDETSHSLTCSVCGALVASGEHTADTNGYIHDETTHSFTCNLCKTEVTENHKADPVTGNCVCGAEAAVASVTIGDTTNYYETLDVAISAVANCTAADNATVKLLKSVDVGYSQTITSGVFTLDLNSKTLTGVLNGLVISGNSTNVTITDCGEGGTIRSGTTGVYVFNGGIVTITGGTISAGGYGMDVSEGSTVTITGGTVSGGQYDLYNYSGGITLSLTEGKTEGATFPDGIVVGGIALAAILGDGAAYWQGDTMIVPADGQTSITGGDVVIKAACDHSGNTNDYTYDDTTHSLTCSVCGAVAEVGKHTGGNGTSCTDKAVCEVCNAAYSDNYDHDSSIDFDDNGFCPNGCYEPTELNESGYYEIGNAGQFFWFAEMINSRTDTTTPVNAVLTGNIDLEGREWTPVGAEGAPYSGLFDGNGYRISNLSISKASAYVGLFGNIEGAGIRNLTVSADISATWNSTMDCGILVSRMKDSILYKCYVSGNIDITCSESVSTVFIRVGGLAGNAQHCVILNCGSDADVVGNTYNVGGLVGYLTAGYDEPPCLLNSYCTGNVTAAAPSNYAAGLVGYLSDDVVNNYFSGTFPGTASTAGVLFGYIDNAINNVDGSSTTFTPVIEKNYYTSGNAIGGAVTELDTEGYAETYSDADDLLAKLNSNLSTVEEIIAGHLGYLQESDWAELVELLDGESVRASHWRKLDNGAVVHCTGSLEWTPDANGLTHSLTCSVCGAVTDSGNHSGTATCTERAFCTICNTEYGELTDHDWTVTYSWNGTAECTAIRTCGNDASHKETAEATITSEETKAPGCDTMGDTTYTATFDVDWAEKQTKTVTDIPATGEHNYATEVEGSRIPATCMETGSVTMQCTCGATEVKTLPLDEDNHTGNTHTEGAKNPDCENKGNTGDTYCECGEKIADGEIIPATGEHNYIPGEYVWSDDNTACTVTGTCGCGATSEANATVTSKQIKDPTCTVNGETTYTAIFTETWATTQTKTVANVPATDHVWSVTYTWSEDGKRCTATHVCGSDEAHNETEFVTAAGVEKTAPTCTEKGWTTYTVDFQAEWAEDQTKDVQDIPTKEHAWSVSYQWSEDGKSCTAIRACGNDETHNETAEATITSEQTKAPTTTTLGETTYTASFAVAWAETQTTTVADIPMLNEVEVPEVEGGHVSVDNETPATGEDVTITVNPEPGKEVDKIVVKDEDGNKIPVTKNEDGTYTYEQPDGDVTIEVTFEDKKEDVKPGKPGFSSILDWIFGWWWDNVEKCDHSYTSVVTGPTCTAKGYTTHTCSKCGDCYKDSYTNALGHAWDRGKVTKKATCTKDGVKTYTCGTCGCTKTETVKATGHKFEDGACSICSEEETTKPEKPNKPGKPGFGSIWDWIFRWWN